MNERAGAATTPAFERGSTGDVAYLRRKGARESPPLVLLHGIGSNAASWLPFMHALDARFACVAWDLPGYGESCALATPWPSPEDYAAAWEGFLDAPDPDKAALGGPL